MIKSNRKYPDEGNGRHQLMMAEEEMQRLPRRMQKLSGKRIVARWDSEKTERHRRRKPSNKAAILSGKGNRECEAYISFAFSYFLCK